MAKRGKREIIKLESSAGTGHFYTTVKNRQNTPNKLEIKKYDPVVRKHVAYKEPRLRNRRAHTEDAPLASGREERDGSMAWVITRLCRDCVDMSCVEVCPVDC